MRDIHCGLTLPREVEPLQRNLKNHNLPRVNQIPPKLIQVGGDKLYEEIHELVVLICSKEEFPQE